MKRLLATCLFALNPLLSAAADRPNIVFILADDLPYAALGCQGGTEGVPTPNIDSLARDGVRFSQASVAVPVCSASRAAILTGCYPQRWGHEFNPGGDEQLAPWFGVPPDRDLLARPLRDAGYVTGLVGKWHLGGAPGFHPLERGFTEFYGFLTGSASYLNRVPSNPLYRGREVCGDDGYLTDLFTRAAVSFIRRHKAQPFFLYVPYTAVHGPLQADDARLAKLAHIEAGLPRTRAAILMALDEGVGAILAALREAGSEKNTLVIFSNDNGVGGLLPHGARGRFHDRKSSVYEGGLRVPLFMRWPGRLAAGKTLDAPVSTLDILPTCLDAAGLKDRIRQPVDGVSLLPFLTGANAQEPHAELFWRYSPQSAARQGRWKLVKDRPDAAPLLFDLSQDPGERVNLAAPQPEKTRELAAKLAAWERQLQPAKWKFQTRGEDNFSPEKQPYKSPLLLREEAETKGTSSPPPQRPPPPSLPWPQPNLEAKTPRTVQPSTVSPFKDAGVVWHMGGADAMRLTPHGNATLGVELSGEDRAVSLKRGGDGRAAKLDGGWLAIGDSLGDTFDGGAYTLLVRVQTAGDALDGTFFSRWAGRDHMPVDFSAWRMPWGHLSTRGIGFRTSFRRDYAAGQDAVLDFYCPVKEPFAGWQDLVVRLTPQKSGGAGVLDLFVNGAWLFRNAEQRPSGLPFEFFLNETPGAIIGAEPGGRWPFRGLVDHVAVWKRTLADAEIQGLSGANAALQPQRRHERDALGQYLLPPEASAAERTRFTNDELGKAIASQIANDPWYPQFHMALVGLPCNLQALYHGGRHHYMLVHRGEALNHNEVFRHLVSDDLVSWEIRPAPLGWPHPIWPNGTFLVGADGKPGIVGGYPITLATAEDDNLDVWKARNDEVRITQEHPRYASEPGKSPGKLSWEEGQTWRIGDTFYMAGGGSHWDSVDAQGKLTRHHHDAADYDFPLYRSADLREWRHVGSFFKNPNPAKLNLGVECGQMIPFNDGRWLWDFTHSYLVGRIENERFTMLHHDTLSQKANFTHWGGWLRDDRGRIVFQTTKLLKLPVPELARLGWGRTHRLPLAATLTSDNRLVLQPIAELTKLRRDHFDLKSAANVGAHFEAQLTFTAAAQGQTGLRLTDGKGTLDIFFDAAKQQLIVDPRQLPDEANHVSNDKRLFTQPLTAKPGDTVTLRVFHDGALTEVFANDENSAHWSWFESPDSLRASIFSRGVTSPVTSAESWSLGNIWKNAAAHVIRNHQP